jgi:hypothetical protein
MLGEERDYQVKDNKSSKSLCESEEELFKSFAKKAAKSIKQSKSAGEK